MDTSVTGPTTWQVIHHLCDKYDQTNEREQQPRALQRYIQSLEYVYSCIFCRQSLHIFLDEMKQQLQGGLRHREMRRFAYDLHNRVNDKLCKQENERVHRCLKEHLPRLLNDPEGQNKVWESIRHELSCILYTQLPPSFETFIELSQPRNEENLWKSLFYGCHGHTLNKEPVNEQYALFLSSAIALYWPAVFQEEKHRQHIDEIIHDEQKSMLRRAWDIRSYIYELQKQNQIESLKCILAHDPIYIDELRDLKCFAQHKEKYGQSFEEVEAEMKSIESHCKEKTCRKTAVFE
jgi:hypothetical protein